VTGKEKKRLTTGDFPSKTTTDQSQRIATNP
jgi:hypothetical protein